MRYLALACILHCDLPNKRSDSQLKLQFRSGSASPPEAQPQSEPLLEFDLIIPVKETRSVCVSTIYGSRRLRLSRAQKNYLSAWQLT